MKFYRQKCFTGNCYNCAVKKSFSQLRVDHYGFGINFLGLKINNRKIWCQKVPTNKIN